MAKPMSRGGNAKAELWELAYQILEFKFHVVTEAVQRRPNERIPIIPQIRCGSLLEQEHSGRPKPLTPPVIARPRVVLERAADESSEDRKAASGSVTMPP